MSEEVVVTATIDLDHVEQQLLEAVAQAGFGPIASNGLLAVRWLRKELAGEIAQADSLSAAFTSRHQSWRSELERADRLATERTLLRGSLVKLADDLVLFHPQADVLPAAQDAIKATAPAESRCRRCTECPESTHHWMATFLEDDEGEIIDPEQVVWGCKHCDFHMPWDDPDEPEDQYQRSRRYPLWCVDTGEVVSEERYRGPFKDMGAAEDCFYEIEESGVHRGAGIRRCRALLPSELPSLRAHSTMLLEDLDDIGADPPGAGPWARWDDSLVLPKSRTSVPAETAFMVWADEFLETKIFVCEGDEEMPE